MIFLVRHGQYHDDDPRDPTVGRSLTALGIRQAQVTAARLLQTPGPDQVDRLYCSDFTRARETGAIIGASLLQPAIASDVFREIDFRYDPDRDYARPEPVGDDDDLGAARRAFEEHLSSPCWRSRHVIIVCHADLIRYCVCRIVRPSADQCARMFVANCSITVLRVADRTGLLLEAFAADDHLSDEIHTFA